MVQETRSPQQMYHALFISLQKKDRDASVVRSPLVYHQPMMRLAHAYAVWGSVLRSRTGVAHTFSRTGIPDPLTNWLNQSGSAFRLASHPFVFRIPFGTLGPRWS